MSKASKDELYYQERNPKENVKDKEYLFPSNSSEHYWNKSVVTIYRYIREYDIMQSN